MSPSYYRKQLQEEQAVVSPLIGDGDGAYGGVLAGFGTEIDAVEIGAGRDHIPVYIAPPPRKGVSGALYRGGVQAGYRPAGQVEDLHLWQALFDFKGDKAYL